MTWLTRTPRIPAMSLVEQREHPANVVFRGVTGDSAAVTVTRMAIG